MNWKKGYTIALLCVSLFAFCACEKPESQQNIAKDSLVLAIGSEPEGGFDPCTGWGRYGNPLIQSTLIDTDQNMNIICDLATDYSVSANGLVWTFQIRDDAFFTDGSKVSAEDVVFTFLTAKNSGSIVDLTALTDCIAKDETTVEFHLKEPQSAFLYTVAATGIVPQHAYSKTYGDNPIGSGPFQLTQWDKGQQIILEANENYYGQIPYFKKVVILFLSEDAALAAAQTGQLDMAITATHLANQKIKGMHLLSLPTIDNRGLTLPYTKSGQLNEKGYPVGNDVTSDLAIRRALSYGIDRAALVEQALLGYGRPAYTECDNMPWWNEESTVPYRLEQAKQILEEAGWLLNEQTGIREKDGLKAQFNLLYSAGDSTRQALCLAVSEQAKELGIQITTEGVSWDEIDRRMYAEPVMMGWGAQNPMETYLLYHKDNMGKDYYNPENYHNATVDQYMEQAMQAKTLEDSYLYWQKAQWDGQTGLATQGDCPWVWLVNVDHLYYVRDGLNIGQQKIHPHGHAWPVVANLKEWTWE